MPQVRVSIQNFMQSLTVLFLEMGSKPKLLGPIRRYADESSVFEILRRAHASLETHNIVENALRENRCCTVVLDLSDEQYAKLKRVRRR